MAVKLRKTLLALGGLLILTIALMGCRAASPAATATDQPASPAATLPATDTSVPPTPTVTPEPLALRVNGQGVTLAEFQAGLTQVQAAAQTLGLTQTAEEQRRLVLDDLITTELLAQAAREGGFVLEETAMQARIAEAVSAQGGDAAFNDWLSRMGYTADSFRTAARRSLEAAWQRDQILAGVPENAEQVHARQILVLSEAAAQQVRGQIDQAGSNFATIAFGYDLSTGGDLGWFPRGYLTQPAVEEAAFALQPGEVSDIIQTEFGYHLVQVIAREDNRPLTPEARQALGKQALQRWLDERRGQAQIEELAP
ncbi:MAG: peptidylprolyl isomerase [Anaerolineae bacterium]|nr:peptidylprolyl isomerase [Anaerolineae bacterium]